MLKACRVRKTTLGSCDLCFHHLCKLDMVRSNKNSMQARPLCVFVCLFFFLSFVLFRLGLFCAHVQVGKLLPPAFIILRMVQHLSINIDIGQSFLVSILAVLVVTAIWPRYLTSANIVGLILYQVPQNLIRYYQYLSESADIGKHDSCHCTFLFNF